MNNREIHLFFTVDDNYIPFLAVTLQSIKENSSKDYIYDIKILHSNSITKKNMDIIKHDYENDNFEIEFVNIEKNIYKISEKLHTRDYYSKSTYFRLFIPDLYPELDKALYLDSDITLKNDVAKLYNIDLEGNLVGAIPDSAVSNVKEFQEYVEKRIGVSRFDQYFNAGILLMDLKQLREINFEEKFISLLSTITFDVAQDQDYLNTICKNHVKIIDSSWNVMPFENNTIKKEDINLIHYNLSMKPWHFDNIMYEEYFWQYAKSTSFYEQILEIKKNYSPEKQAKSQEQTINLIKNTKIQADDEKENQRIKTIVDDIMNKEYKKKSVERLEVLKKIDMLEENGIFDVDVENDPESSTLMPNQVDYLRKKLSSKIKRNIAYKIARKYMNKLIKDKQLIIKGVIGIENWKNLTTGAIITCNHFSAMDSFAMQYAYDLTKFEKQKRKFYKVIKEGNYTSFLGIYGFFMRNCNTLPLSSNSQTMKKFLYAVDILLKNNEFVLVYPEQSMWWNYRKPKPLKTGAYNLAVRSNVPVVPCFITMEDSTEIGADGFPIQELTIHIEKPIYPNQKLSRKENIETMMNDNFEVWKKIYEKTYGITLEYLKK